MKLLSRGFFRIPNIVGYSEKSPSLFGGDKVTKKNVSKPKKQCQRCLKEKIIDQNYYAADEILYPNKYHICKQCVWEIIEQGGFDAFITVLRSMNRPFIKDVYNDDYKKYLTQINSLPQYKNLTYEHSIFDDNYSDKIAQKQEEAQNSIFEGTRVYSKKWMGYYTPAEIKYLDDYYENLHRDFKIITANHKDYAKKIAKASLHLDKCFQDMLNGEPGADKKYKDAKDVFDTLCRSAKFSENTRGQNDVSLGNFGKVFEMVENNTYIPEHIPIEPDQIDKLIEDFKHIFKSL